MRILWEKGHAEVGPFKLNSRQFNAPEGDWYWEASTPGYVALGAADYHCKSEAAAKAGAQAWVAEQLLKFMNDLGVQQPIVISSKLYELVKCESCYGTGRWGSNGAEEHQPCHGTGKIEKEVAVPADRCSVCGHPESAPAHHLTPSQTGPPWYPAWDHPFMPKEKT
jgi:hypothetical protein